MATKVRVAKIHDKVTHIAGVDVAVAKDMLVGCICVLDYTSLDLVESTRYTKRAEMAYIPGYLSFREIPVLLHCYKKLKTKPDLILVDGQGIAHPRALGLASHLGVLLGKPTIGCAKSHLYGTYEFPEATRGASAPILARGDKRIGWVLRTREAINPIFVSPGHLVDLEDCKTYVLNSTTRYRLPEPIRYAHRLAGEKARRLNV
jgi:deoxyribonuclease V